MKIQFIKWNRLLLTILVLLIVVLSIHSFENDEYCTVIDDLREIDAVKVVNTFDHSKIAYFVDLHNGYQILVKKNQIKEANSVLTSVGINNKSELQISCKLIN